MEQRRCESHDRLSPLRAEAGSQSESVGLRLPSQILKEREQAHGLRRQASAPGPLHPPARSIASPASSAAVDPLHVKALEAEKNKFKKLYASLLIACEQSKAEAQIDRVEIEAENARLQAAEVENARLRSELAASRMQNDARAAQAQPCEGSSEEFEHLGEQLKATQTVNATLNGEVVELQRRLRAVQRLHGEEMRPSACVVCLERNANVVSMPCKHLALCISCGARPDVTCCPICRTDIQGRLQIFLP